MDSQEYNENSSKSRQKKGEFSEQKVVDKQKQSLLFSYETLGNLLSSAENFAGLENEQYGKYNISTAQSHDELKSEFAWELNCFQLSIKKYKKKYGEYIFPKNYSKEKIINDIKRYIKNINVEKDKVLYYSMINIINGEKSDIDFEQLFEELEDEPDKKFDPSKLSNLIGPINCILEDIEKNAEEGNMSFNEEKGISNQKEKLKNIKMEKKIPEKCNVIIGIKGKLYELEKLKYKFINKENKNEKLIEIKSEIDYKKQKLYSGKNGKDNISFYLLKKKKEYYVCYLFEKEKKEIKKSDIIFLNNNCGYIKVPVLCFEDLK